MDDLVLDSIAAGLCLDIAALLMKRNAMRITVVLDDGTRWVWPTCPLCGADLRARCFAPECPADWHIDV